MIFSALAGLAAGGFAAAISELWLRWWAKRPQRSAFEVVLRGAAFRLAWLTVCLAWAVRSDRVDPPAFAGALLAAYLGAQVFEGLRYRRFVEQR